MNNELSEVDHGVVQPDQGPTDVSKETSHEPESAEARRWARVVARAWDDEEFRRRLLAQPREVLREEGFDVPDDAEVEIVDREPDEQCEEVTCLRLPPQPVEEDLIEDEFSPRADSAKPQGNDQ